MKRAYVITFCITFLILVTVVMISFMILLPQQTTLTMKSIEEYSAIKKSDYTFAQTNLISFDSLVKEYSITDAQIQNFKNNQQYIAGNSDPFVDTKNTTNTGNSSGTTNTGTQGNTNNGTVDKITNSNGGVKNPPSTNK